MAGIGLQFSDATWADSVFVIRDGAPTPIEPQVRPDLNIMPPPDPPTLQNLHRLDRSSPEFNGQLSDTLYGEEYQRCVPDLRDGDLLWLVDYLDKVCHHEIFPHSSLKPV